MIRDAAIGWVLSNVTDRRFHAEFVEKFDLAARNHQTFYVLIGPGLTKDGKLRWLHCFSGQLFIFEMTPAQARSYKLTPGAAMWGVGGVEEQLESTDQVSISGLEIDHVDSLLKTEPLIANISFDANGPIGPCVFRLDYEIPGHRSTVGWSYVEEGIYINQGRIQCRFMPVQKPNLKLNGSGPLAMFLRLCALPNAKVVENRQPISNVVGALVTVVDDAAPPSRLRALGFHTGMALLVGIKCRCGQPHTVWIDPAEDPADDSIRAFICPNTRSETRFRLDDVSVTFGAPPPGSIKTYEARLVARTFPLSASGTRTMRSRRAIMG